MLAAQDIGGERKRIQHLIDERRLKLEEELMEALQRLQKELPKDILGLSLREFLKIENLIRKSPVLVDRGRRVTRSMANKIRQSITTEDYKRQTIVTDNSQVAQTPKFHPGLPETPAAIRGSRPRKSQNPGAPPKNSNIFAPSTVRASINRKHSVGGLMSVELTGGQVLDVDITESPSKLLAGLGQDAVVEMKKKMQEYAAHLKSFFKRLKVHDK